MNKRAPFSVTFSTALTLLRILLTPCIVIAILAHAWGVAVGIFVAAAVTDLLDGAFARLFDEHSLLGACLDPIADKLLLVSCYGALMASSLPPSIMSPSLVYLVLVKELMLLLGAGYVGLVQRVTAIRPSLLGKAAMLVQTVFVFLVLLLLFIAPHLLSMAAVLQKWVRIIVIASLVQYTWIGLSVIIKGNRVWYVLKRAFAPLFSSL